MMRFLMLNVTDLCHSLVGNLPDIVEFIILLFSDRTPSPGISLRVYRGCGVAVAVCDVEMKGFIGVIIVFIDWMRFGVRI